MRMWDGVVYPVDWVKIDDPTATVMPFGHPFGSMFNDTYRPFDLGAVGEIPQWLAKRSTLKKPSWVCKSCFCGTQAFWQSGWPFLTPGVVLKDGFATCCVPTYATLGGSSGALLSRGGPLVTFDSLGGSSGSFFNTLHGDFAEDTLGGSRGFFAVFPAEIDDMLSYGGSAGHFAQATSVSDSAHTLGGSAGHFAQATSVSDSAHTLGGSAGSFTGVPSMLPYGCQSLNATGTTQATAAPLTRDLTFIKALAGQTGVILPNTCGVFFVQFDPLSATAVNIYPPVGGIIDGLPPNAPQSFGGNMLILSSVNGSTWVSVALT